jgi:hypothetical protein
MAKAKATPVKKEPKQIVLTQEQFDTLISIYDILNEATDSIEEVTEGEFNLVQLGYQLGMVNNDLFKAYSMLDTLTDDINPNSDWFNDEDEDNN